MQTFACASAPSHNQFFCHAFSPRIHTDVSIFLSCLFAPSPTCSCAKLLWDVCHSGSLRACTGGSGYILLIISTAKSIAISVSCRQAWYMLVYYFFLAEQFLCEGGSLLLVTWSLDEAQRACNRIFNFTTREELLTHGQACNSKVFAENIPRRRERPQSQRCVSPQCKATEPEGGRMLAARKAQSCSYINSIKIDGRNILFQLRIDALNSLLIDLFLSIKISTKICEILI